MPSSSSFSSISVLHDGFAHLPFYSRMRVLTTEVWCFSLHQFYGGKSGFTSGKKLRKRTNSRNESNRNSWENTLEIFGASQHTYVEREREEDAIKSKFGKPKLSRHINHSQVCGAHTTYVEVSPYISRAKSRPNQSGK